MAIVLIPGIKGSKLADTYPPHFDVRWSLEDLVVGDLFEDPLDFELRDGLYDVADTHVFREWELMNVSYKPMIHRLRQWVDKRLYLFPYDWRLPIERNAVKLNDFINHLQGKLAHYGDEEIHFVAHSMGGLLLRSALGLRKPRPFDGVGRIVFISPPFRGACDTTRVLIAGERQGWFGNSEDFRKLARGFQSVYQLLPSYPDALINATTGKHLDVFDKACWQKNVLQAQTFRSDFLANAEAFFKAGRARHGGDSSAPMLSDSALRKHSDQVLVMLSTGHQTMRQVSVDCDNKPNPNWFDFEQARKDHLGDGRVHLKSAAIRGITLAAYKGAKPHGMSCRDETIINSTSMWLTQGKLLRMQPRSARDRVRRSRRKADYFARWDGRQGSLSSHITG